MSDVLCSFEINFEKSDVVFNALTKKVLPESIAMELLETEREGHKLYEKLTEERIVGSKSIWDTINKRKLSTFANNKKVVNVKIRNQLIKKKTERKLMSLYTIASRSRPDVDLPSYLGKWEFLAVPRSIFTEEGDLIRSKDKSKITSEMLEWLLIENIAKSDDSNYKVIVFDGMVVGNKIVKKKMKLKSC